jgi:hypothetical protein
MDSRARGILQTGAVEDHLGRKRECLATRRKMSMQESSTGHDCWDCRHQARHSFNISMCDKGVNLGKFRCGPGRGAWLGAGLRGLKIGQSANQTTALATQPCMFINITFLSHFVSSRLSHARDHNTSRPTVGWATVICIAICGCMHACPFLADCSLDDADRRRRVMCDRCG